MPVLDKNGLEYLWGKIKAALAKKSDTGHTHNYLPLSGGTLTGAVSSDANNFLFNEPTEWITPNKRSLAASPFSRDAYHNIASYAASSTNNYCALYSTATSADGKTWVNESIGSNTMKLFINKEAQAVSVVASNSVGREYIFHKMAWTSVSYVELGFTYTSPSIKKSVEIAVSNNNSTWTVVRTGYTSASASTVFIGIEGKMAGNAYLRIRITRADDSTGSINMSTIKLWTDRKGDQGAGIEYEVPYNWDESLNILPRRSTSTLGTSSSKWGAVYANRFYGAVADAGSNAATTFAYSKAGLDSATWLAAWNGYELRAIKPEKIWRGIQNNLTSDSTTESLSAAQGKELKRLVDAKAEKGDKGDKGDTGAAGVSVSSVKQTTTSTADGGTNVITVTLSNGATAAFNVKNGSKGSTGAQGPTGPTGPKGSDATVTKTAVVNALGYTPPKQDTTYTAITNAQIDALF